MSKLPLTSIGSALLLCAGAIPATGALAADKEQAVEASLEGARYVAMGSSYAAGPMLPPSKPGAPARCGQSMNNYPTLLAERFNMVLVDRTCSGARTDHVLGRWGDIPPQIEAVNEATRLVTVTIGGNDLNYVGNLFTATCHARAREATAVPPAKPCPAVRVPTEADYFRVEARLNEIARRVRAAAPRARLVFVQYLTPLPAKLCAVTPISDRDATVIRRIGTRLAEITGRVAQANRAVVVEMNQSSVKHTPCDAEPWMIGSPKEYDGKEGMRWHLNLAGMKATADGIAYWLAEVGTNPTAPQQTAPMARTTDSPQLVTPQVTSETPQTAAAPAKPDISAPVPGD